MVEVDETRDPCSLVLIGPVNAGKSTISEYLMVTMGVINDTKNEKFKEEKKSKKTESEM